MRLNDLDIARRYRAIVQRNERITPDSVDEEVREITLCVETSEFQYAVGQSIGILVPGPHDFGHQEHLRLYTIADTPAEDSSGRPLVVICVRRCSYIDTYSGERFPGIASNYLCDRDIGAEVTLTGPYGAVFEAPEDRSADLLMIGLGTGIAPFRAFIKHIYEDLGDWRGQVMLFYGARTGLEMLYMNDRRNDFAQYIDQATFTAITALSSRPDWNEPMPPTAALEEALNAHRDRVWEALCDVRTHVYVAGVETLRDPLDKTLAAVAGGEEKWKRRKAELEAGGRSIEFLY